MRTTPPSLPQPTLTGAVRFTPDHEWIKFDDSNVGVFGITDYAQKALGDVVFVDLPDVGSKVEAKEPFSAVESVKAASDVYAPVAGEIAAVNEELSKNPALINTGAMGEGWIAKIKVADVNAAVAGLLDEAAYAAHCAKCDAEH